MLLEQKEILDQTKQAADGGASDGGGSGGAGGGSAGGDPFGGSFDGGSSSSGESGGSDGGEGASERSGSESGSTEGSSGGGSVGSGGGGEEGGVRTPPDVGDGSDDDIVARQLREAAESEDDPELRERLWDEYRAYKSGRRAPARRPAVDQQDDEPNDAEAASDPEGGSGEGDDR